MTTPKPNKLYDFILPLLWEACDGDDDDDQLVGWYNLHNFVHILNALKPESF